MVEVQSLSRAPNLGTQPGLIRHRLPCGLEIRVIAGSDLGSVSDDATVACQLWIRAGAADEREHEHGCAHLLEHMLFKPLQPRAQGASPSAQVDATFDLGARLAALGADANAYTSHDETVFHFHGPRRTLLAGIDLLFAAIFRDFIDPEELAREQKVVLEEIKQYDDDPLSRATQDVIGGLYGEHAYGRPVLGLTSEVQAHTAEVLLGFHRRYYHPANAVLSLVGPVDPTTLFAALEPMAERFTSAAANPRDVTAPQVPERPQIRIERADVSEASMRLAWQAPAIGRRDAVVLDVVAACLGHGDSSRLVEVLRRREQVVADVHAALYPGIYGSIFMVSAQADAGSLVPGMHRLLEEVERCTRVLLSAREIEAAKNQLRATIVYRRETVQGQAHAIGWSLAVAGSDEAEEAYFAHLEQVTPEVAREVCKTYLVSQHASLVAIVPEKAVSLATAKALVDALRHGNKRAKVHTGLRELSATWRIHEAKLACGLRVTVRQDTSLPMASGFLMWPGGARLESAKQAGMGGLLATLLTRGTERHSGSEVARIVEGSAAAFGGFCGRQSLGINFECLRPDVAKIMALTFESAVLPHFAETEIDEERRVMLQELIADEDDLSFVANRALLQGLFGAHPYGRDRRGSRDNLESFDQSKLARFFAKNYPIGRACFVVVGDVEPIGLLEQVADALADLGIDPHGKTKSEPLVWPGRAPQWPKRSRWHKVARRRDQAHLVIGFPGLTLTDPRSAAMDVLLQILSGSNGRLFFRLREEKGLVYSVGAGSLEGIDAGHLTIEAASAQARVGETHEAIVAELRELANNGPSASELEVARAALLGQNESSMQRRGRIALHVALAQVLKLPIDHFLEASGRIRTVNVQHVTELARQMFLQQVPTFGLVHDPRKSGF